MCVLWGCQCQNPNFYEIIHADVGAVPIVLQILNHVIEGKIEGNIRRGRRRMQLLGELKEKVDIGI